MNMIIGGLPIQSLESVSEKQEYMVHFDGPCEVLGTDSEADQWEGRDT